MLKSMEKIFIKIRAKIVFVTNMLQFFAYVSDDSKKKKIWSIEKSLRNTKFLVKKMHIFFCVWGPRLVQASNLKWKFSQTNFFLDRTFFCICFKTLRNFWDNSKILTLTFGGVILSLFRTGFFYGPRGIHLPL